MVARNISFVLAAAAVLAALAGCHQSTAPRAYAPSGSSSRLAPYVDPDLVVGELAGEVRRSPVSAISEEGVDNSRPYPGISVEIRNDVGELVGVVVSGPDGSFSTLLPVGYYDLRPRWPATPLHRDLSPPSDVGVAVYQGGSSPVLLLYPTGIL
jgi:hypothetical protein